MVKGLLDRRLSDDERRQLEGWKRSENRVRYLRARIVLLAEETPNAAVVARALGVHVQTVRDLARTFRQRGLKGLEPGVRTGLPRHFGQVAEETLIALLHESPAKYGLPDGRWTLEMAAQVLAKELSEESVSIETVRRLLKRRRHSWQRAKEWLVSPDPLYAFRKDGASA